MRRLHSILWLIFALAAPAAAQTLEIAPEPDWIEVVEIPADDPKLRAEVENGEFYLLSDHQMRWVGKDKQSYGRTVAEVTDRAGLEGLATLRFDFDPEFEQVTLVRLRILRGGQEIDLKEATTAEIYRRETRLDEGIIDGTLTAVVQVPDLRVGDVLDYATILVRSSMIGAGEMGGSSWLEWNTPVVFTQAALTWPKDLPLILGPLPPEVTYSSADLPDGSHRHVWRRAGHLPPPEEENVPYGVIDAALLRFSDTDDWTPLAKALAPHYTADYALPAEWQAKVDAIATAHPTPDARAFAALRLVQDELRYVSLSVGAGGYFARSPAEVIAAGFGDCKDKSLLLRVILSRLGVEAAVALTDLDGGYGLPDEMPVVGAFDHMILRAKLDGRTVWMDPTGSHAGGGLGTAVELDYGYALAITGQGSADLERMEVSAAGTWSQEIHETFTFSPFGVFLAVETRSLTGAADGARARWATNPVSQISRDYLNYYQDRYPGMLVLSPPLMTDNRAANEVVVTESYFLPPEALDRNGLREDFFFGTENLVERYPKHLNSPRRLPFLVSGPWVARYKVEVIGAPIEFEPPEPLSLRNGAFAYSFFGMARDGGNMTLSWAFEPLVHAVPADQVEGILEDARKVYDTTGYTWDLNEE